MNFYGWIGAGLVVFGVSFWAVLRAIAAGAMKSPTCLLLVAVYLVLVGHFGIMLSNYCARVAKVIETEDDKRREHHTENVAP